MNTLQTERLLLRRFQASDWKDLHEYLSDPAVVKYEPYDTQSEEECRVAAARRSQSDAFWAVCLKETGKLIGNIYFARQEPPEFLTWELGYVFNAKYHGRGYATEASKRILKYGFEELGAHRIIARCNTDNTPSWRLMERLAMRREGHFIKAVSFKKGPDGNPLWHSDFKYSILDEEFLKQDQ